jgi:hypothetical protein
MAGWQLSKWCHGSDTAAVAYLPRLKAWLFYDVKFNGTRLLLAQENAPGTKAFLQDYLDNSDTIMMPRVPMPRRVTPQLGFWCTIAMKHLVGIRSRALRPDRLWKDCIAAGGKPNANLSTGVLLQTLQARIRALPARITAPIRCATGTQFRPNMT